MKDTKLMNSVKDVLLQAPIAHRGLHDNNKTVPENSLEAFQRAIDKNYAIELDVHLLSDGNIAVFHDDTLDRMCRTSLSIKSLNKESIKNYTLANSKETIPLFTEVLSLVNDRVPLLIEIKQTSNIKMLGENLSNFLNKYEGRFAIQSFNPFLLGWFAKNKPGILRGQLSSNFQDVKMSFLLKKALQHFLFNWKSKPQFIAYDINDMPNPGIERMRRKGIPVICWTVRSKEEYASVTKHCDNIIFENFNP